MTTASSSSTARRRCACCASTASAACSTSAPCRRRSSGRRPIRSWLASEDQEAILLHALDPDAEAAQLVEGSEGAGKTTVLAMWHYLQWLAVIGEGREGLQTAPTNMRLGLVRRGSLWRPEWYRYVTRKEFVGYELADGSGAAHGVLDAPAGEAQGSPVQGFNGSWGGHDEAQDQIEVHEDIESRGRAAKNSRYPQLGTATQKDSTKFQTWRDELEKGGQWRIRSLLMCEPRGEDLRNS